MDKPLILGRYRPLETAGVGGAGSVEVAYDTRIQRKVAIKRISLDGDEELKTKGLAEARTVAMLAHSNIVTVYDFEIDEDEAYLIMEYVDGATVGEAYHMADEYFNDDELAAIAKSVAAALDYAHQNQVLHLDIKPANILIDRNGSVKVADFGIAELSTVYGWNAASAGTIGYMPPEQICGEELDQRSDEWSFACVMYQLICGTNPFTAKTLEKSLNLIEGGDIIPPSAYRPDLGEEIDEVLLDALSPSKDVRYDTILDFARELLPLLGDPAEGKKSLAKLFSDEEEEEEERKRAKVGLWDRLGRKGLKRATRVIMAGSGAWLTYIALNVAQIPFAGIFAVIVAVALSAVLAPALGSILCIIAITASLILSGQPIAAAIVGITGLLWWIVVGRKDPLDISATFLAPVLTLGYLFPLTPMLAGFFRRPLRAVVDTAYGAVLTTIMCSMTDSYWIMKANWWPGWAENAIFNLTTLIESPYTWVMLFAWIVSALIMALLCKGGNKMVSLFGTLICGLLIAVAVSVANYFGGTHVWALPELTPMLMIVGSIIIMMVITFLGAPYQGLEATTEE